MSFLTSRISSTLSPPRQRESTTSFRPLARGRWRLSTSFVASYAEKVSVLPSDSIISSDIFQISLDVFKISSDVFQIPSDVFSVCLVSMRKMCATTTTIHGLSVQPDAHARELLSLCTLKSRLRSVKFSLRTFRPGRCKRR